MDEGSAAHYLIEVALGIGGVILAYLLNKRESDRHEEREETKEKFDLLFRKHDEDSEELEQLKIQVARNYHDKSDIAEIIGGIKEIIASMRTDFKEYITRIEGRR